MRNIPSANGLTISVAIMVKNENNCLFEACLESVIDKFDEVVVIDGGSDDGTLELLDKFDRPNLKIIHKKWHGSDGFQRNQYLKYVKGDWVLVIDADEVLGDNGVELYNLAKEAEEKKIDAFDIHMIHFMWHLGLCDASTGGNLPKNENYKHFCPRRFFKNKPNLWYEHGEHVLLQGVKNSINTERVTLYHYSDCRGLFIKVIPQSNIDFKRSNIHNKEYMKWWRDSRLFGFYPVKKFTGTHPSSIRRLIEVSE